MIKKISLDQLRSDSKEFFTFFKSYILDPIQHIKFPPKIHWQSAALFVFCINIIFGMARAIVSKSIISAIMGFLITPIMSVVLMVLSTLFLGYFFRFVLNRKISYQQLFILLFVAYVPGSLFFLGSIFYPPLFVLGLIVTASLVVVGFVENLQVAKSLVIKLVVVSCTVILGFWLFEQIYINDISDDIKSLDQLEKEIESVGNKTQPES